MIPLPIDEHIPEIRAALASSRAVVVVAEPGAGKTTRVPSSLVDGGPVILLQPRRVAARSVARRIAEERGWTPGREVGWHVRFDRRFADDTRLLIATEGILTARLQQDPLLSTFSTVVLDEFHERSIHADLGIALARQAWRARDDLRIVVMSATIDADAVAVFLGGCPIVRVGGRLFPVTVSFEPSLSPAEAVRTILPATSGDVLCFLPGAAEIRDTIGDLTASGWSDAIEVLPLHGGLDAAEQDRATAVSQRRRVIAATNIAETSLTVPGVTGVVDSGLHKVARYDADRGIDSLATERVTQDAADQRAGRAARTAPGHVIRLWDARDRLRPHREAEIHRIDLAAVVLDVLAWGGAPRTFEWFDAPRASAVDQAMRLLERLGATVNGTVTPLGARMQRLPLHPRLARILIEGNGRREYARACAILAERLFLPSRTAATASDLLSAIDRWRDIPPHVQRAADDIERLASDLKPQARTQPRGTSQMTDEAFCRAILAGYPDRVAQRRGRDSRRLKLASGAGAVLARDSGVEGGEFLVALDVHASLHADDPDGRVRMASRIDRSWIRPTSAEIQHRIDESGTVRAFEVEKYDALVLAERPASVDSDRAAALLAAEYIRRPMPEADARLLRRLAFMGRTVDLDALVRTATYGVRRLDDVALESALPRETAAVLSRDAPEFLTVPSGRTVRLEYADDGSVSASVKLQELFGLAQTPRVGPRGEPLLLVLLAPNGRPVQMTRDLRSFWDRTYPEVRKELRGRYPKHPWPEDPWNAPPTARALPSRRKVRN